MNGIVSALVKMGISIFLLAIAFWPEYGAAWYIARNFTDMPALWSAVVALWVGALALNLPMSVTTFRKVTSGSIVVLFGAGIYTLWQAGFFALDNMNGWIITGIIMLGTLIGWWTTSVPLWRWYRKTLPTDEVPDET